MAKARSQPEKALTLTNDGFKKLLKDYLPAMKRVASSYLEPNMLIKLYEMALSRTPKLLACSPMSIVRFGMTASELGLRCGGARPQIHPVPFFNDKNGKMEVVAIIDYRGMVAIVRRYLPDISFKTGTVYDGDEFDYKETEKGVEFHHRPCEKFEDQGAIRGHWCRTITAAGRSEVTYLSVDMVARIRAASPAARVKSGPWIDWPEKMGEKSAVKAHCNLLEVAPPIARALEVDDRADAPIDVPFTVEEPATTPVTALKDRIRGQRGKTEGKGEEQGQPATGGDPDPTEGDPGPVPGPNRPGMFPEDQDRMPGDEE